MPAFVRGFGAWLIDGGWLVALVTVGVVLWQTFAPQGFLAPTVLWGVLASAWLLAYSAVRRTEQINRPALAIALFSCLGFAASAALDAPVPAALGTIGALTSFLIGPLLTLCLLTWPNRRIGGISREYLVVDLAIIALAVGLLVWSIRFSPGQKGAAGLDFETIMMLINSVVTVVGISLAALRGPSIEFAVPFLLTGVWVMALMLANSGVALVQPPERVMAVARPVLTSLAFGAGVFAAESLRRGWRWPWRRGTVESSNPVPWVAVSLIGVFVLKLGIEQMNTVVGPVVIGTVITMALLVLRQTITMRHNERLQAERSALEADTKIAALVRHTSDVIVILDDALKIRYASPSAEGLWDRSAGELVGTPFLSLIEERSQGDVNRVLAERLAKPGQTDSARWRIPAKGTTPRRVEAVAISLFHEPSVSGLVITLRDQTERILLEEQLSQSQKMEAIGQLAGGVAHDFNNLLTTILGHAEVGQDIAPEGHPVRADLAQIIRASELAASLTKQLLAFSRKQVIEPRVIQVAQPLEQVVKMLRRLMKENITTALEIAPDLWPVRVDPTQLEQVVLNLAVNARDAMPVGGRLTIRVRKESVRGPLPNAILPVPSGDCTVVEVIDTGVGMDQATMSRIFEPFFTTKGPGRGTGLGLATVYGIVQHSGAGLALTSEPGRGSTFAVYLPRASSEAETPIGTAGRANLPRLGASILLVEDEAALREITQRVLAKEGYRVLVAANADDALTLAASAQFPIDLMLADVVMPGMSGAQLAVEMKGARPGMRVLLMSGYPGDDLTGELRPDQRFLRKPFTQAVLLEHVRAALTGLGDAVTPDAER